LPLFTKIWQAFVVYWDHLENIHQDVASARILLLLLFDRKLLSELCRYGWESLKDYFQFCLTGLKYSTRRRHRHSNLWGFSGVQSPPVCAHFWRMFPREL